MSQQVSQDPARAQEKRRPASKVCTRDAGEGSKRATRLAGPLPQVLRMEQRPQHQTEPSRARARPWSGPRAMERTREGRPRMR